ncbi:hypothetical protein [Sphingobium baderi]|uniref:Uncharacterized protein n=1 Tax=Sphingobium baderi TaxID=1332080 RepID=A0A0S3F024_9SPHN|nr:hypothetical protein [Sphingobium baderi]ALR20987.1 hypothetical protein ATN00_12435 [Sphingobium baderi]
MTEKLTFIDHLVSREHRFSIGVIGATREKYLSIPVTNQRVDYEKYYRIDDAMFDRFAANPLDDLPFVERCRQRREDSRLILQPGADRGIAS